MYSANNHTFKKKSNWDLVPGFSKQFILTRTAVAPLRSAPYMAVMGKGLSQSHCCAHTRGDKAGHRSQGIRPEGLVEVECGKAISKPASGARLTAPRETCDGGQTLVERQYCHPQVVCVTQGTSLSLPHLDNILCVRGLILIITKGSYVIKNQPMAPVLALLGLQLTQFSKALF